MSDFILFGTQGCHLCEEAEFLVQQCLDPADFSLKDITDNPELMEEYGIRIPVFHHGSSQRELSWPFDKVALAQFIETV